MMTVFWKRGGEYSREGKGRVLKSNIKANFYGTILALNNSSR
jgi:hypothetical protein